MNGAECGACGYITCECDRIARDAEVTKDKQIKSLQAENERLTADLKAEKKQVRLIEKQCQKNGERAVNLQAENTKLKEIAALALDIHTRDPMVVMRKWGFVGVKAEELLVSKIEALKGESDG